MAVIATGNRDDALEIVQDAMFKLVKKYADKSPDEWGPLFTRIVQSTIRDWYRRSKVRNTLRQFFFGPAEAETNDAMDAFEHKTVFQPDQELKHTQAMKALDAALYELPLRQQQAFLLRQWQGLDVKQTATAMGCSQGSVKTHLSRAIASLKDRLEEHRP
jgi:RNA polymerase sigma-70 factor (ECF subfamily)